MSGKQDDVEKVVSPDCTYIDYLRGNDGVRVRRDSCQAIVRHKEGDAWVEHGPIHQIPLEQPSNTQPLEGFIQSLPLPFRIAKIHDDELEKLVQGNLYFEDAISRYFSS